MEKGTESHEEDKQLVTKQIIFNTKSRYKFKLEKLISMLTLHNQNSLAIFLNSQLQSLEKI